MLSLPGRYQGVKIRKHVAPRGRGGDDLIPAPLKAKIDQYKRLGNITKWWAGGSALLIYALINVAQYIGIFHQMFSVTPSFFNSDFMPPLFLGFVVIGVTGVVLTFLRDSPVPFAIVMSVATVAVLGQSFMGMRAGWGISGSTVAIRPAEPWKPDIRFTGADVASLQQGCYAFLGKGGLNSEIIFNVHYQAGGAAGDWGVNRYFTERTITPALAASLVDSLYGLNLNANVERSSLPKSAACVNFFTQRLDAAHVAKFLAIVGPGAVTGG